MRETDETSPHQSKRIKPRNKRREIMTSKHEQPESNQLNRFSHSTLATHLKGILSSSLAPSIDIFCLHFIFVGFHPD